MLQKRRSARSVKKRTFIYIAFLFFLVFTGVLVRYIFFSKSLLFISPLGKGNIDTAKIEKILKNNNISFSDLTILSDSLYGLKIQNNGEVKISSKKDIDKQISSLQKILRELTIEGKPFKSIDFRFNEPIISF
ncbi:MAG: hypothetical protein Q7R51_01465 [bacterium]|nr:hypothetical protein [bacterium]